ncbi:MAG: class I SAM-dependent methyltransferase [bacterium]
MKTDWHKETKSYDEHLRTEGAMHKQVVIPGVFKLFDPKKGEAILDIACGQGQLAAEYVRRGARVSGIDAAKGLIELAKTRVRDARFFVGDAKSLAAFKPEEFDGASCILALQNIDDINPLMKEVQRVLKHGGRAIFVINHPMFRIPRQSSWGFDETQKTQYRRVDGYMSEMRVPIIMHPGQKDSTTTMSFHRPLSSYTKAMSSAGLVIDAIEEWVSPKTSIYGPKATAENRSRAEIPLFMAIRVKKI